MTDEIGTEATRSDAPSVDDALFGDVADNKPAAAVEGEDSDAENTPEQQGSDDAAAQAEAPQEVQDSGDAGDEAAPQDGLKVVVSIKGGRATVGVQQPSSDPHIEAFDGLDEAEVTHEVSAVIERARARWEETPKHPAYERPAPPARRRNRRQQGTAQGATAEGETAEAQEEQQTLRLF